MQQPIVIPPSRPPVTAETMLLDVYRVVQRHSLPDGAGSRRDLLDELLEVLDGPAAWQVYHRLTTRQGGAH